MGLLAAPAGHDREPGLQRLLPDLYPARRAARSGQDRPAGHPRSGRPAAGRLSRAWSTRRSMPLFPEVDRPAGPARRCAASSASGAPIQVRDRSWPTRRWSARPCRSGCWPTTTSTSRRRAMSIVTPPRPTGGSTTRRSAWVDRLAEQGRIGSASTGCFLTTGDSREPELAGIRGASGRLGLDDAGDLPPLRADRHRGRRLSRGVRAQEPADRPDRGQRQQSRGGALDRLRPAWASPSSSTRSACRARRPWSAA